MARSAVSRSTRYYTTRSAVLYQWPTQQLLVWRAVMYATGGTILGIFAAFLIIQQQLELGVPWLFPYGIAVGALTVAFLLMMDALLIQGTLLPGLVMLHAFVLIVLYLAGMIETALQLFGSPSNVNGNCNTYVMNQPSSGVSLVTFAFLEQRGICQSWDAVFAFWIVGLVFLVWIVVLSSQYVEDDDTTHWRVRRIVRREQESPRPAVAKPLQSYEMTGGVPAYNWRA